MSARISERAVLLGKRQSLVGIVTRVTPQAATNAPAVVILNTGIIHRVGHHRMFVTMSRALARAGHTVLRFDLSGIGDSEPEIDGLSPMESCLADIKSALDWLEKDCQVSRVILVGLCSGADQSILYGHTDARVTGLVLMDPSIPATARYYFHYISRGVARLNNWRNITTGCGQIVKMLREQARYALLSRWKPPVITLENLRFQKYLQQCYANSVDRGIQLLAVFTGDLTRQTYPSQMIDAFPRVSFGTKLRLESFSDCDHTFSREADRTRLIQLILTWIGSNSPGSSS